MKVKIKNQLKNNLRNFKIIEIYFIYAIYMPKSILFSSFFLQFITRD